MKSDNDSQQLTEVSQALQEFSTGLEEAAEKQAQTTQRLKALEQKAKNSPKTL